MWRALALITLVHACQVASALSVQAPIDIGKLPGCSVAGSDGFLVPGARALPAVSNIGLRGMHVCGCACRSTGQHVGSWAVSSGASAQDGAWQLCYTLSTVSACQASIMVLGGAAIWLLSHAHACCSTAHTTALLTLDPHWPFYLLFIPHMLTGLTSCQVAADLALGELQLYSWTVGPDTPAMSLQLFSVAHHGAARL